MLTVETRKNAAEEGRMHCHESQIALQEYPGRLAWSYALQEYW